MSVLKDYYPPEISFVLIAEDVITESLPFYPGQDEGELCPGGQADVSV